MRRALVVGVGVTGRAVAAALSSRDVDVVIADDDPSLDLEQVAGELGTQAASGSYTWDGLVAAVDAVFPSPGLGDDHPVIHAAREADIPIRSEFDLAAAWDDRPLVAITGTDGKTTVTTLVAAMLVASGRKAVTAGNTEVPLVTAIQDPAPDVFVVEASSFRLAHTGEFRPDVGTWLNVAPDHLDRHGSWQSYIDAKAAIWRHQRPEQVAVGNADDPIVAEQLRAAPARHVSFGLHEPPDGFPEHWHLTGDRLVGPAGEVATRQELWRDFPHDILNALAGAASAVAAGASLEGCHIALRSFRGLPHRISLVADQRGIRWFDDSKATTPNAALAAVQSFESVVLIAGGRNKGLDLAPLAGAADRLRAVVAIGEAAPELEAVFAGTVAVIVADSMAAAVQQAGGIAQPGDAVLLSPACASFDWYGSYAERGDDFAREVCRWLSR